MELRESSEVKGVCPESAP